MKCKICGAKIKGGAKFCENCGMKVEDERVPYTPSLNIDAQYANQRPYKKPWYRKWWIWTILGVLTAVIVCAVFSLPLLALAHNNYFVEGKNSIDQYLSSLPEISAPYADIPDVTVPSSSAKVNTVYKVGEICDANGMKITLEKSEDYESEKAYIQPEAGKKFIRVYFNIKNETGTDQSVSSSDFACYADGFKCEENIFGEDLEKLIESISNGRSTKLYLCYEVPINAESIEVEYDPSYGFSPQKYTFIVK